MLHKMIEFYNRNEKKTSLAGSLILKGKKIKWIKSMSSSFMKEVEAPYKIFNENNYESYDLEEDPESFIENLPMRYHGSYFWAEDAYSDEDGNKYKMTEKAEPVIENDALLAKGVNDGVALTYEAENPSELTNTVGRAAKVDRNPVTDNKEPYFEKSDMKNIINSWFYKDGIENKSVDQALVDLKFSLLTSDKVNYNNIVQLEKDFSELAGIIRKSFYNVFQCKKELDIWLTEQGNKEKP